MELPQTYVIDKIYSYSTGVRETNSYLNGCCPVCREGKSWGKRKRLFYFLDEDYIYCHNCFSGDVKILTLEHGPIEFKKIKNCLVTIKCKDGVWRKRIINSYGIQPVFKYTFSNLAKSPKEYIINATENHKWFIKRDKKRRKYDYTTNLKIGDRLDSIEHSEERSIEGLVHGIIFGDGTYRKYKGSKRYAIIRVCKQDSRKDEILKILSDAGYKLHYPPNYKGDVYVNLGNIPGLKDVPATIDPKYIAGFIYGLWLTDGHNDRRYTITTTRQDLVEWIRSYASMGGFRLVNEPSPKNRKNCYSNAKPIYSISLKENSDVVLRKKEFVGVEEVFCLEEPVTGGFYLADNILTGNCNRGWNTFYWVKEVTGQSFKQIKEELKDYSGDSNFKLVVESFEEKSFELPSLPGECVNLKDDLQLKYFSSYPSVNKAKNYCSERRLFTALNAPKTFYCCVNDKFHGNRLIIPYYNSTGKIENYISRKLLDSDSKAKYLVKFGSKKPIFNLDKIDENYPYIFIFEGQIDSMFVKNGVAVSGVVLTDEQEQQITSSFPFHNKIWVLDNYRFEKKEVIQTIKDKLGKGETMFFYPNEFSEFKDLNEYCVKKGLDFINPDLLINGSLKGDRGILKLGED